jgi:hypothetical protein
MSLRAWTRVAGRSGLLAMEKGSVGGRNLREPAGAGVGMAGAWRVGRERRRILRGAYTEWHCRQVCEACGGECSLNDVSLRVL